MIWGYSVYPTQPAAKEPNICRNLRRKRNPVDPTQRWDGVGCPVRARIQQNDLRLMRVAANATDRGGVESWFTPYETMLR